MDREMIRPPSSDSQYTSMVFFPCFFWNAVLGWGSGSMETVAASNCVYTENCFVLFFHNLKTSIYRISGHLKVLCVGFSDI